MSYERNELINDRLKRMIEKLDETGKNHYMLRSFDDYLFHRRHLDRLLYMLDLLLPYCGEEKHMADLGSNIIFPYLVKLCSDVQVYDGITRTMEGSEYFNFREDGSIAIKPTKYPFRDMGVESGISVPLIHTDLSKDNLHYPNDSVDIVTCYETLEHIRCDPMHLYAETHRVLKPGGLFMLTTPNANSISNLKRMMRYESPNFYPPFIKNLPFIEHIKEYSVKEIQLLFESAGFEIERLETFNHVSTDAFNHYEAYQIDYHEAGSDEAALRQLRAKDAELERKLLGLLEKEDASANRGDYILVFARKASEVKDRYCVPIYESFEL